MFLSGPHILRHPHLVGNPGREARRVEQCDTAAVTRGGREHQHRARTGCSGDPVGDPGCPLDTRNRRRAETPYAQLHILATLRGRHEIRVIAGACLDHLDDHSPGGNICGVGGNEEGQRGSRGRALRERGFRMHDWSRCMHAIRVCDSFLLRVRLLLACSLPSVGYPLWV